MGGKVSCNSSFMKIVRCIENGWILSRSNLYAQKWLNYWYKWESSLLIKVHKSDLKTCIFLKMCLGNVITWYLYLVRFITFIDFKQGVFNKIGGSWWSTRKMCKGNFSSEISHRNYKKIIKKVSNNV